MSNTNNKSQGQYKSILEALRDIGNETASSARRDFIDPFPSEFSRQILGHEKQSFKGEIFPGEALEIKEVKSGRREEVEVEKQKVEATRQLVEQDKRMIEKRTTELRVQIQAIQEENSKIAKSMSKLSREVEIATFQASTEPSEYELTFVEQLFEYLKSFSAKINTSAIWLANANRRAARKNVWGANYKKHRAKYLLSGEHYASRSAA